MVACHGGMSRSPTTVICYLILKRKMTAFDALTELRKARNINPSKQQLLYVAKLHNKIFGFEGVNEDDDENPISFIRSLIPKNQEKKTE